VQRRSFRFSLSRRFAPAAESERERKISIMALSLLKSRARGPKGHKSEYWVARPPGADGVDGVRRRARAFSPAIKTARENFHHRRPRAK